MVGQWMWDNKNFYNGLSVLPFNGGTYTQAPFEDCTEEEYNKRMTTLTNVDLTKVIEIDDNTAFTQDSACAGGKCEINV
jgi:ribonucleoside-triphosphate reductase (thioredoxin)